MLQQLQPPLEHLTYGRVAAEFGQTSPKLGPKSTLVEPISTQSAQLRQPWPTSATLGPKLAAKSGTSSVELGLESAKFGPTSATSGPHSLNFGGILPSIADSDQIVGPHLVRLFGRCATNFGLGPVSTYIGPKSTAPGRIRPQFWPSSVEFGAAFTRAVFDQLWTAFDPGRRGLVAPEG